MMMKDFGARVASVWEGLRPMTKKMLEGALRTGTLAPNSNQSPKFSYDAHADWEVSRLLSALDEQARDREFKKDADKLKEIADLAETCVRVLESQSGSAEVFIQLAERALKQHDYKKLDHLSDRLAARFSSAEIAEIVRQTEMPQIRAIAYETLSLLPVPAIVPVGIVDNASFNTRALAPGSIATIAGTDLALLTTALVTAFLPACPGDADATGRRELRLFASP